jgi:hypothetical protein
MSPLSYPAINCYPNKTCQLFPKFPVSYRIEPTPGGRLYFPQQSFPNASQCCMPNITYLLNRLKMAPIISAVVSYPRDAVIDEHGYLVTVEIYGNNLDRFDANNLTQIDNLTLPDQEPLTVTDFQGTYYVATSIGTIIVINSDNLTVIARISTQISGIRGIIFLNNGQTMVVSSVPENSVIFLNRTSLVPIQYNVSNSLITSFSYPHGLWRVNDSFFYVTSYGENSVYSFHTSDISNQWISTLVLPPTYTNGQGGGARVTIDECGRFWSTFEIDTIFIHDQQGRYIGNWTIPNSNIFDIRITDNYLIHLTDTNNNDIMRIDPGFQCYF